MTGLLATNGTIPSASYRNAFSPPIQSSTTISPTRVTATPDPVHPGRQFKQLQHAHVRLSA